MSQAGGTKNRRSVKDKIWSVVQGDFMESWMNRRTLQWVTAIGTYLILQIFVNFTDLRKKGQIDRLNKEITELRMEKVTAHTMLMGARRLSAIEERVREENLNISIPKSAPYVIEK